MLTILSQIIALAHTAALDSNALSVTCAVGHHTDDPVLSAATRSAHAATSAALAAALAPFGARPTDKVVDPHDPSRDSSVETLCRVYGSRMVREAAGPYC